MSVPKTNRQYTYLNPGEKAMDIELMTDAEKARYEQLLEECRALIANEKK